MVRLTDAERFWGKVDVGHPLGCWEWTAGKFTQGYGQFSLNGNPVLAHRWAYEALMGELPAYDPHDPDTITLDHLCRNRACVNPDHLEPVPIRENVLRGAGVFALNAAKKECKRGHPLSGDNLTRDGDGHRACRECLRAKGRNWYRDNLATGDGHPRDRTHCPQGHEYDEANTYRYDGRRHCRACLAAKARRQRARKKAVV